MRDGVDCAATPVAAVRLLQLGARMLALSPARCSPAHNPPPPVPFACKQRHVNVTEKDVNIAGESRVPAARFPRSCLIRRPPRRRRTVKRDESSGLDMFEIQVDIGGARVVA